MQKQLKKILFPLYIAVLLCMGAATIIEKYRGSDFVSSHIYGSWWFTLVWAALAAVAIVYFVRMKVRHFSAVLLHLSFIIILLGALLTHLTSERGMIHLRMGTPTDTYMADDGHGGMAERTLPFKITLSSFDVKYHDGTTAEADYESKFTVTDGDKKTDATVSMNNIFTYNSVRFYQASYDRDMRGSMLSINSDPYGIPVTYTGYALLFISLIWILIDPKGAYRRVLRSPLMKKGLLTLCAIFALSQGATAATVLPKETAERFGQLNILYNNRICPLQTFAIDFTKKLYGSDHYKDYTPEQVLTGFIFWGDEWSREPMLKLKSGALRETLQLPKYASINTFFNKMMGGYIIGPYVQEYYQGNQDELHKQVADVDDRIQLVMELRRGTLLKIFPFTSDGKTTWYSPTDNITDAAVDSLHRHYMQNVFTLIYQEALAGNNAHIDQIVGKMRKYQKINAGTSLPSATQIKAERMYNSIPFATILFMLNLGMGFITLFYALYRLTRKAGNAQSAGTQGNPLPPSDSENSAPEGGKPQSALRRWLKNIDSQKVITFFAVVAMLHSFFALTLCLALRWIVSGTVPMANGYETMLFMAWLIMLLSLIVRRRFHIVLSFGFLMSGFFLLVSHINQMDPNITHVMPVLDSPLLSIHVSIIMMSFALLSLTFICALTAVILRLIRGRRAAGLQEQTEALRLLSDLFLYPALAALGLGIFIGAIWANVSWGTYWSWDAKEVWGLITFMVYAVSVHRTTLPFLCRPMGYHAFMIIAFLSIIMTYFGVNYFLGGMHSYA